MKKIVLFMAGVSIYFTASSQLSLATDLSVMHNFGPQQNFFAIGQTVQTNFHVTPKQSVYVLVNYFGNGHFTNTIYAPATSSGVNPSIIRYTVKSYWRYHQYSIGIKHYFLGSADAEKNISIYGLAGFGLVVVKVSNNYDRKADSVNYKIIAPVQGDGTVNKLSFDLGAGIEWPLAGDFYGYADARTWIPASTDRSSYLRQTYPVPVIISAGIRIYFPF